MSKAFDERDPQGDAALRRRRIIRSAILLALVAVGFYASIFWAVSHRH
jgi:hypothetical protein